MTSEQHTNVDGGINGNALSGDFHGPVQTGQNVTVNVQPPIPPPPDTATHGERIKFLTVAMMQLQSYFVIDRNEREERVKISDARYEESKEERAAVRRMIRGVLVLVLISLLVGFINFLVTQQIISRLGWLW